jgi:hypothetical protein
VSFEIDAGLQARASRAAMKIGGSTATPVLLRRSRHICLLLPDLSIVARVAPATAESVATGTRELHVARFLHQRTAPVVAPCETMPAEPFVEEGMAVTLWPHVVHDTADYDDEQTLGAAAHALRRVHDVLADYPGALPSYAEKIEECAGLLCRADALPGLAADDRSFLTQTYDRLRERLARLSVRLAPIHGDAHLGNVFITPAGPLWTDFEAACRGPREWDISGVPYLPAFPPVDADVYAVMLDLRSLCVAVWCSASGADPDKREAAEYHLARLHRSAMTIK